MSIIGQMIPTPRELQFINGYVDTMVRSKTLPKNITHFKDNGVDRAYAMDVQIARCFVIVMRGWDIGLKPSYAVDEIGIVNGKPTLSAKVMLAKVEDIYEHAQYRFKSWNKTECVIEARKDSRQDIKDFPFTTFSFTIGEAREANLLGKWNWKGYPRIMLKWRVVADMCRTIFPKAILGFYVPDELGQDHANEKDIEAEEDPLVFPDLDKYKQDAIETKTDKDPESTPPEVIAEMEKSKKKKPASKPSFLTNKRPQFKVPTATSSKPKKKIVDQKTRDEKTAESLKQMSELKKPVPKLPDLPAKKPKKTVSVKPKPKGGLTSFVMPTSKRPKLVLNRKKSTKKPMKRSDPTFDAEGAPEDPSDEVIEKIAKMIAEEGEAKVLVSDKAWSRILTKDKWLSSQTAKSRMEEDFALDVMESLIKSACKRMDGMDYEKGVLKIFEQELKQKKRNWTLAFCLSSAYYHIIEINISKKKGFEAPFDLLAEWNDTMRFKIGSLLHGLKGDTESRRWDTMAHFIKDVKELTEWTDGQGKWAYRFMIRNKFIDEGGDDALYLQEAIYSI